MWNIKKNIKSNKRIRLCSDISNHKFFTPKQAINMIRLIAIIGFILSFMIACTSGNSGKEKYLILEKKYAQSGDFIGLDTILISKSRLQDSINGGIADSVFLMFKYYDGYPAFTHIVSLKSRFSRCNLYLIDSIVSDRYYVRKSEIFSSLERKGFVDGNKQKNTNFISIPYLVISDSTDPKSIVFTTKFETMYKSKLDTLVYYKTVFTQ